MVEAGDIKLPASNGANVWQTNHYVNQGLRGANLEAFKIMRVESCRVKRCSKPHGLDPVGSSLGAAFLPRLPESTCFVSRLTTEISQIEWTEERSINSVFLLVCFPPTRSVDGSANYHPARVCQLALNAGRPGKTFPAGRWWSISILHVDPDLQNPNQDPWGGFEVGRGGRHAVMQRVLVAFFLRIDCAE